ncbi:hypothetical protein P43SY_006399 [Pythium insidiosum]|uniref:Uncharacterized protein n=1 Tax=Pythium insidiosum TaxID=114742 RepID=A0AAD5Q400_PYTIN|nr:hypothetical protein P43SY_006399 [Pythium insidiosum]
MALTRRNVVGDSRRSSSIWEEEADHYWKEMESAKQSKKARGRVIAAAVVVVVALVTLGGIATAARAGWRPLDLLSLRNKLFPSNASNAIAQPQAAAPSPSPSPSAPSSAATDAASVDLLRARCRVRGVQTRWHEETCRKLCIRDPQHSACMNGCSYGSIATTKAACDRVDVAAIAAAQQCPDAVQCGGACAAYEHEPAATRAACERACTNIVPSSCARILQILRDLQQG